jgi:hypothetical protein
MALSKRRPALCQHSFSHPLNGYQALYWSGAARGGLQALDIVLKHRASYNKDCLPVSRAFFYHDQNVRRRRLGLAVALGRPCLGLPDAAAGWLAVLRRAIYICRCAPVCRCAPSEGVRRYGSAISRACALARWDEWFGLGVGSGAARMPSGCAWSCAWCSAWCTHENCSQQQLSTLGLLQSL